MEKLIKHIYKYNKGTNIDVEEFQDRLNLIIDKENFDIVGDNLYEYYWHYCEGERHFEFLYVLKNTSYKLIVSKGIEVFKNLNNPYRRFQLVGTDVNISFPVRTIYSEEDRRTKEVPRGCVEYEKEVWVVLKQE